MRYFGPKYPSEERAAPVFSDIEECEAPIGQACGWCEEPILEGETGLEMPSYALDGHELTYWHHECHLRTVLGSVAHLEGRCGCKSGNFGDDDAGYPTRREAAKAVRHWLEEQNRQGKSISSSR